MEILLKEKHLKREQLDEAIEIQKEKHIPLRKILAEKKIITEDELLPLLSEHLYMPTLHLAKYRFDPEVIKLVPVDVAKKYGIIPISKIGETITVAMSDPLNVFALDDLRTLTNCSVDIVLSTDEEISTAIGAQYQINAKGMGDILDEEDLEQGGDGKQIIELLKREEIDLSSAVQDSQKAPIVKLVDLVLNGALKRRASDIHVEPEEDCLRIRYRIDGALHNVFSIPQINQNGVLARLKIISNLDITENRIPQDGRFKVKYEGREIDFRVSSLPTTFGQKFVLRLLDKSNLSIGLDKLGFSAQPLKTFREAIKKPFGMILVTGPTGSGKSTTLYSVLNQLNTPERNIITVEEPVEYQIEGITQIQVRPEIGLSFAMGLRALLRQSPDVIMIGEIRDPETADIAIKASLTGQLVLSTLHTNDAISSVSRIIDMGVEPFLAASSLVMLCAQRLCRRICQRCRKKTDIPADFLKKIGFNEGTDFYKAEGCKYCSHTGYYGRVAILESLMIDDPIREMIMQRKPLAEIKEYAVVKCGMKTLRDDAYLKVKQELTTLDEALRITTEE
ncbi:GspE/PulE family protein [Candidatus Omnitrophota bacterium]